MEPARHPPRRYGLFYPPELRIRPGQFTRPGKLHRRKHLPGRICTLPRRNFGDKTISLNSGAMIDGGILAEIHTRCRGFLHTDCCIRTRDQDYPGLLLRSKLAIPTARESQMAIGIGTCAGKDGRLDGINLCRHLVFRHLVYKQSRCRFAQK